VVNKQENKKLKQMLKKEPKHQQKDKGNGEKDKTPTRLIQNKLKNSKNTLKEMQENRARQPRIEKKMSQKILMMIM
jgi:hypothetical protein